MPNHELVPAASSARHMVSSIGSIPDMSKTPVYLRSDARQFMMLMPPQLRQMCLEHSELCRDAPPYELRASDGNGVGVTGVTAIFDFYFSGGGVLTTSQSCRARSVRFADTSK